MNPVFATATKDLEPKQAKVVQETPAPENPSGSYPKFLQIQRAAGNRAFGRLLTSAFERAGSRRPVLQAKLIVGPPGDRYEQEADRVAEHVVRMPTPDAHQESIAPLSPLSGNNAQRACDDCEEELEQSIETEKPLRMKSFAGAPPEVPPETEVRLKALPQGGQPLPESVRSFFEPRLGSDFGRVRIHTSAPVAETATVLKARAFTLGQDIVFAPGQYAPESVQGKSLIAHELTHVVQQNGTAAAGRQATLQSMVGVKSVGADGLQRSLETSSSAHQPDAVQSFSKGQLFGISKLASASAIVMRAPEGETEEKAEEEDPGFWGTIGGGLAGEFIEDPTFAQIGVDTVVSVIPVLDQISDARDIVAHLYFMIFKDQYNKFMRWVGLVFSLIGVIPEIGSVIKSASKVVIKGVKQVIKHLDEILKLVRKVLPGIDHIDKFYLYLMRNWDQFLDFGTKTLQNILVLLSSKFSGSSKVASVASYLVSPSLSLKLSISLSKVKAILAEIRGLAPELVKRAFNRIKTQLDDVFVRLREHLGLSKKTEPPSSTTKTADAAAPDIAKKADEGPELSEIFRKGGKVSKIKSVSLKRLKIVLGKAGASARNYVNAK